jgi:hypothetical protein
MSGNYPTHPLRGEARAFCRHVGAWPGPACAAQYRHDRTASAITLQDRLEVTTARWAPADIRHLKERHTWAKDEPCDD